MDDKIILDWAGLRRATLEEVQNYLDARIEELAGMVRTLPPPPTDEVTARAHLSYRNRLLIHHGRCIEAITAATAWGLIPPAVGDAFKTKLLAVVNWKFSEIVLGAP